MEEIKKMIDEIAQDTIEAHFSVKCHLPVGIHIITQNEFDSLSIQSHMALLIADSIEIYASHTIEKHVDDGGSVIRYIISKTDSKQTEEILNKKYQTQNAKLTKIANELMKFTKLTIEKLHNPQKWNLNNFL